MSKGKSGKGPERENRRVRVGDTVTRCQETFGGGEGKANRMRGTVVYVHPKGGENRVRRV